MRLLDETLNRMAAEEMERRLFGPSPLLDWFRANQGPPPPPPTLTQRIRRRIVGRFRDWHERLRVAGNALRGHYDDQEWD